MFNAKVQEITSYFLATIAGVMVGSAGIYTIKQFPVFLEVIWRKEEMVFTIDSRDDKICIPDETAES